MHSLQVYVEELQKLTTCWATKLHSIHLKGLKAHRNMAFYHNAFMLEIHSKKVTINIISQYALK